MQIYRGTLELLDYVFYATVERGKVYETGAFIHNYALAYALGLVRGETYTYARLKQSPHYQAELAPLNGQIYLTPGSPLDIGSERLPPGPTPLLGQHTDEVLAEVLGLDDSEIGDLHDRKVVAGA